MLLPGVYQQGQKGAITDIIGGLVFGGPSKTVEILTFNLDQFLGERSKSVYELKEALKYFDASEKEKDFSKISSINNLFIKGKCVYCNHCLPCPVGINIGEVVKLVDLRSGASNEKGLNEIKSKYDAFTAKASECIDDKYIYIVHPKIHIHR